MNSRFWKGRDRGSVSVFLLLVVVFVMAVIFALLEVSRVWGLEQRARTDCTMTENSLLAGYDIPLWESYGLLLLNGSDSQAQWTPEMLERRGLSYARENLDVHGGEQGQVQLQTWNLYGLVPQELDISVYGLVTDQNGRAFRQEAVQIMKGRVTEEMLKSSYQRLTGKEEADRPTVDVQETERQVTLTENPIEVVEQMKKGDVLERVVGESDLSQKTIDLTTTLSRRSLQQGNYMAAEDAVDWRDKLLFRLYLEHYFPCYTTAVTDHILAYELEYVIGGKGSDVENLRYVVNRLLLMREVANLAYLRTDVTKQEMALAAATALGAATFSPELIPVYKAGIMAAWAYAESVSDVRILLDGQRVSMIKTASQWHTDLRSLGSGGTKTEQSVGLSYQEYLQTMLWTQSDGQLAYRAMDLIERNTDRRMDCQVYYLSGRIGYQGKPLFPALLSLGQGLSRQYRFEEAFSATYLLE